MKKLRFNALHQCYTSQRVKSLTLISRKFSIEAFPEVSAPKLSNRQRSSRITPPPPTSSSVSQVLEKEKEKLLLKNVSQQLQDPLSNAILNEIYDEEYNQAADLELMDLKSEVESTFSINEKLLKKRLTLVSSRIYNDSRDEPEVKVQEDLVKDISTLKKAFRVTVDFDFDDISTDYMKWIYHRNTMLKSFTQADSEDIMQVQNSEVESLRKVPSKLKKKKHLAEDKYLELDLSSETINEREIGIHFSVIVEPYSVRQYRTKELKSKMFFSCIAGNYGIIIKRIKFISSNPNISTESDDENVSSVRFNSCRRSFQKECYRYLHEQLKIDNNFSLFILGYSQEKEQKEYFHWLENVLEFIPPPNEGSAESNADVLESLLKQLKR
jgi:hypothetical protein